MERDGTEPILPMDVVGNKNLEYYYYTWNYFKKSSDDAIDEARSDIKHEVGNP